MSREKFTPRQMDLLRKNEYTYEVTESQIFFTRAFKEKFWTMYQGGMTPRQIVAELGYDPDILGTKRLSGIQLTIKKQAPIDRKDLLRVKDAVEHLNRQWRV